MFRFRRPRKPKFSRLNPPRLGKGRTARESKPRDGYHQDFIGTPKVSVLSHAHTPR